jgi:hypothetical protein
VAASEGIRGMTEHNVQISVHDKTIEITFEGYGITTFTIEALETGVLRVTENYAVKPKSGRGVVDESSICITAVDRHTIEVYNV